MTSWSDGYVTDVGYTTGYYKELAPHRLGLGFLSLGLVPPQVQTACELGFGQGMSLAIHAAASDTQWWGADFNPEQVAFAQDLVKNSGLNARAYNDAFEEFVNRNDLPGFDFIGLHGVWSWVSDANRKHIVRFIDRHLNVGGVVYGSYNTLPGWAGMLTVRELMQTHARREASSSDSTQRRIENAVTFATKIFEQSERWNQANPGAIERLQRITKSQWAYLAHEYFNRDWQPMHFGQIHGLMESARLSYAGSAHYVDQCDMVNFTPAQLSQLADCSDPVLNQTLRDIFTNQGFRRDYWVKGKRKATPLATQDWWRAQRVLLAANTNALPSMVNGALGPSTLVDTVYQPLFDALGGFAIRSIGDLETELGAKGVNAGQVRQAILLLAASQTIVHVQPEQVITQVTPKTQRLNAYFQHLARDNNNIGYAASPVSGQGVEVPRMQQLFLGARASGRKEPTEWAMYAWEVMSAQHQRLTKEGKTLEEPADMIAELTLRAKDFARDELPILCALGIT
jgi:hypothetical protein